MGGLDCYEINLGNRRHFPWSNMKLQCFLWHCRKKGDDLEVYRITVIKMGSESDVRISI